MAIHLALWLAVDLVNLMVHELVAGMVIRLELLWVVVTANWMVLCLVRLLVLCEVQYLVHQTVHALQVVMVIHLVHE